MAFGHTRLLLTTALIVPLGGAAWAQTVETACDDLTLILEQGLPETMRGTEDDLRIIAADGNGEICLTQVTVIREQMEVTGTAEAEAVVADTAETTLTLQDEVTVQGTVYLERTPPSVDIAEGETDVQIEPGSPSVTVAAVAPEIVVRQAPAEISVDMPQPTIRITQAAPEIIITMPDPNVSVGAARPTVEVRQAEPVVTVTQVPPRVELELSRVEDGAESTGFSVNDRSTGTAYRTGEVAEPLTEQDADVRVTKAEPIVTMMEPTEMAQVEYQRAEPTVRFEQADPVVSFGEAREPIIEFSQSGEPVVTFRTAQEGEAATDDAGMAEEAEAETEAEMETATEEAAADIEEATDEAAAEVAETTDEAAAEVEEATSDADRVTNETPVMLNGPSVEREGYTMLAMGDINYDELEGVNVYGIDDENVGEIGELILSSDGKVEQMIVEVGGFLGLGEKHVALPFDRFTLLRGEAGDLRAYVESSQDELEQLPEYEG